jgi:hypothetical protein
MGWKLMCSRHCGESHLEPHTALLAEVEAYQLQ